MTTLRSALCLALSAALFLAAAPVASAEIGLSGIGGAAHPGGGLGVSTDNNYAAGNTNMIHPGSIGGGSAKLGSMGGSNTDDSTSTGGGHANLRGLGPSGSIGFSQNRSTKIGGTGMGAAVPGGTGG